MLDEKLPYPHHTLYLQISLFARSGSSQIKSEPLVSAKGQVLGNHHLLLLDCHLSAPSKGNASLAPGPRAHPGCWKMNYVSFISKKQSWSPFVIKFAVRETLLYLITSDISWLLVLETIKV